VVRGRLDDERARPAVDRPLHEVPADEPSASITIDVEVEDVGEVAEHVITESKFASHGSTMMMHALRQSGGYPENDEQCRAGRENPKTTCFHNSS